MSEYPNVRKADTYWKSVNWTLNSVGTFAWKETNCTNNWSVEEGHQILFVPRIVRILGTLYFRHLVIKATEFNIFELDSISKQCHVVVKQMWISFWSIWCTLGKVVWCIYEMLWCRALYIHISVCCVYIHRFELIWHTMECWHVLIQIQIQIQI